jgi:hypothetical protein
VQIGVVGRGSRPEISLVDPRSVRDGVVTSGVREVEVRCGIRGVAVVETAFGVVEEMEVVAVEEVEAATVS